MINKIYANVAKEVLQLIGVTGAQVCEPICNAIVMSKCHKTDMAVAVIKEVTKDMTVFQQIGERFFETYTNSLEFIEKSHQKTIDAYVVAIANEETMTFEEKVRYLSAMQGESNRTFVKTQMIQAGSLVTVVVAIVGGLAYGKRCNMLAATTKMIAKTEIVKAASPFAGVNEILFLTADLLRNGTKK